MDMRNIRMPFWVSVASVVNIQISFCLAIIESFRHNKLVYSFLVTEFGVPFFDGGASSWGFFVIGDDEGFQFDTFPFPCRSGRYPKTIKYRCPQRRKENMNTDKAYAEKVALEYAAKETSKVVALKKLDRKAKMGAQIFGYSFGIVMTLLLGVGMCFSLQVIGSGDLWQNILGYVVGILGIVGVSVNYFIYQKILAKGKQKYGSDIIALANEIAKE